MLLSRKQTEYVNEANHRWNFKGGATRSGKTYLDYRWMIPLRIRERTGLDGLTVILGVTKYTIERNVLEPMRTLYGDTLVGSISSDNTARLFGERCYCLGAEKVSQVSKIRGSSIKYCYGDEVADWSQDVFELLKSRLDKDYSCFDGTYNPQYPEHWLKTFLDSDADIYSQTYSIDDNPFLPVGFVENLKKEYAGTVFYDRYILGLWALAEGLIYPMFDKAENVTQDHGTKGEWYLSMDYGTMNPTAMGLWRIDRGTAVMEREYYYDGRKSMRQKTDEDYYRDLEDFVGDTPIRRIIIDPSAASMKATIRKHGKYSTLDADNNVINGIRWTGTLIGERKVKIHSSCASTLSEFGLYRWDESKAEDAVIKEHDHSMDQMRYLCQTLRRKFREETYTPLYMGGTR